MATEVKTMSEPYRTATSATTLTDETPYDEKLENGLRDVLLALRPFDGDQTERIFLAIAALYRLDIVRGSDLIEDDEGDE